jgi:hypothetical protein
MEYVLGTGKSLGFGGFHRVHAAAAREMTQEVNETLSAGGGQWGRSGPRYCSADPAN